MSGTSISVAFYESISVAAVTIQDIKDQRLNRAINDAPTNLNIVIFTILNLVVIITILNMVIIIILNMVIITTLNMVSMTS